MIKPTMPGYDVRRGIFLQAIIPSTQQICGRVKSVADEGRAKITQEAEWDVMMAKYDRLDIYERDGFRCLYCGFDGSTFEGWRYLTIDHVNPTGSRDDPDNLATCCSYCNSCKHKDPCLNVTEAKEIVGRHDAANRKYWKFQVEPRIRLPAAN